jgi:hypothetical protein
VTSIVPGRIVPPVVAGSRAASRGSRNHNTSIGAPVSVLASLALGRRAECRPSAAITRSAWIVELPSPDSTCTPTT